jgi:hypothetical protein
MAQDTEFIDTFLNDVEKDLLQQIADNPAAVNALKKLILANVYFNGTLEKGKSPDPTRNAAIAIALACGSGQAVRTDAELGQDLRAFAEGVRLVEGGFGRLEKLKSAKPAPAPQKKSGR